MACPENRLLEKSMSDNNQEKSRAAIRALDGRQGHERSHGEAKMKRSTWILVSLLSLLFLVTLANGLYFTSSDHLPTRQGERGLASVGDQPRKHSSRRTKWEHEIAKSLSKKVGRSSASVGRPPTELQRLLFERLSGNYSVRLNKEGKLQEILFVDQDHSEDHLAYVENPVEFILDYKSMMPNSFADALKKSSQIVDNRKSEIYTLRDAAGLLVGEAHFELDLSGRLHKLLVRDVISK